MLQVDRRGRATVGEPGRTRRTSIGTAAGTSRPPSRPWTVRPTVHRWAQPALTCVLCRARGAVWGALCLLGDCRFLRRVVASSLVRGSNLHGWHKAAQPHSHFPPYLEIAKIYWVHMSHCSRYFFPCIYLIYSVAFLALPCLDFRFTVGTVTSWVQVFLRFIILITASLSSRHLSPPVVLGSGSVCALIFQLHVLFCALKFFLFCLVGFSTD